MRRMLSLAIVGSMFLLLLGGALRFPDGPIRECPAGYCGKWSQNHTRDNYRLYTIWNTVLWVYWPLGIVALLLLNRRKAAG